MNFSNIRIVLVNTSHPGNIGACARAMKTMGLTELYLVQAKLFPHPQADERAAHAKDVLDKAIVVENLIDAIHDCHLVLGASARLRDVPWSLLSARAAAQKIAAEVTPTSHTALLFGNEQSGLHNEELHYCHYQIEIPANPAYCSLNLAAAVQVVCYELRMAFLAQQATHAEPADPLATIAELESFYQHLERVLFEVEFLKPTRSGNITTRLRCLFNRAQMDKKEVRILRGILTAIAKHSRSIDG